MQFSLPEAHTAADVVADKMRIYEPLAGKDSTDWCDLAWVAISSYFEVIRIWHKYTQTVPLTKSSQLKKH